MGRGTEGGSITTLMETLMRGAGRMIREKDKGRWSLKSGT